METKPQGTGGGQFLAEAIAAFPFNILVIETDNGSELKAAFDEACRKKKITHVWAEPSSQNQNAYVESSHSIDQKEFYEQALLPDGLEGFRLALRKMGARLQRCASPRFPQVFNPRINSSNLLKLKLNKRYRCLLTR
jgi:transposase InsO family protein